MSFCEDIRCSRWQRVRLRLNGTIRANFNEQDSYGFTPLIWIIRHHHVPKFKRFMEHAESINFALHDVDGFTALTWAVREGQDEMVEGLLQHTSARTIDATCRYGHTALWYALLYNQQDIISMLLDSGAVLGLSC